ncbi:hypothetical protein Tco_1499393 [Tanacetum coccineum]
MMPFGVAYQNETLLDLRFKVSLAPHTSLHDLIIEAPSNPKQSINLSGLTSPSGLWFLVDIDAFKLKKIRRQTPKIEEKEESSNIGKDDKSSDIGDKSCEHKTNIGEKEEWMEYEQPLDLVENVEANIDPSLSQVVFGRPFVETIKLILDSDQGLIIFTDEIRVILSDDDVRRGCERAWDLESGFYKGIGKLGTLYKRDT